jgi:hypothetical protein
VYYQCIIICMSRLLDNIIPVAQWLAHRSYMGTSLSQRVSYDEITASEEMRWSWVRPPPGIVFCPNRLFFGDFDFFFYQGFCTTKSFNFIHRDMICGMTLCAWYLFNLYEPYPMGASKSKFTLHSLLRLLLDIVLL